MGRAIDLFVTYRFIKILVTPFEKQEAYKLGVIDKKGNRIVIPGTNKPTILNTIKEKNSYTVLHKLVFNIKKIFDCVGICITGNISTPKTVSVGATGSNT